MIDPSLFVCLLFLSFPTCTQKPGKWCAAHVQTAWQIYYHQQKVRHHWASMRSDGEGNNLGQINDLKGTKSPSVFTNVLHPWIYTSRIRWPIEANGWIWATSPSNKPLREFCFHNKSPQFDFSFSFYYQIQTSLKFFRVVLGSKFCRRDEDLHKHFPVSHWVYRDLPASCHRRLLFGTWKLWTGFNIVAT